MSINSLLKNYYGQIENDKSKTREIIAFCFFCIGTIALSFFHEPWFDEFQAWGISKDNLYNILFVIPHYEGHPPFWHLILKCFTHFNLPPELCIKIPNLTIMFGAIWLLIFKSPFPRLVRLTLPFTYFLFYQYAIISRPYSIFVFAIFLCALFFNSKDTHPFRFVVSLAVLCLSSAYGMIFTTGITIAWALDFIDFKNFKISLINFFKTKQFKAIFLLFVFCFILLAEIFPSSKNASRHFLQYAPLYLKFLFSFFGIFSDATIFDIVNFNRDLYIYKYKLSQIVYSFFALGFGIYLVSFLINCFKKIYRLNYLIIPYFIFCSFCFLIYYWPHHVGVLFAFLIFLFWTNFDVLKEKLPPKYKKNLYILILLTICTQLSWSLCAYINEYKYDYAPSRQLVNYIKEYNLYEYKIFSEWREFPIYKDKQGILYFDEDDLKKGEQYEETWRINPEDQGIPVIISPYFNKNIFQNFNIDYPEKLYLPHLYRTPKEQTEIKNKWKEKGLPDILIGKARLDGVWEGYKTKYNYFSIKNFCYCPVWKNLAPCGNISVFAHKNLYDRLQNYDKNTPK